MVVQRVHSSNNKLWCATAFVQHWRMLDSAFLRCTCADALSSESCLMQSGCQHWSWLLMYKLRPWDLIHQWHTRIRESKKNTYDEDDEGFSLPSWADNGSPDLERLRAEAKWSGYSPGDQGGSWDSQCSKLPVDSLWTPCHFLQL